MREKLLKFSAAIDQLRELFAPSVLTYLVDGFHLLLLIYSEQSGKLAEGTVAILSSLFGNANLGLPGNLVGPLQV